METTLNVLTQKGKSVFNHFVNTIYPPLCLSCRINIGNYGICSQCWQKIHLITGHTCRTCSLPLPGEPDDVLCDNCLTYPPNWERGAAATIYSNTARKMVLALKHGDRLDMAPLMARWMCHAGQNILEGSDIIVPVPLHYRRMIMRKFNQSAILSEYIAQFSQLPTCLNALTRTQPTKIQKKMTRQIRKENQEGSVIISPKAHDRLKGKVVTLVDDVMTTGATLFTCAQACKAAGCAEVRILVFARVAWV